MSQINIGNLTIDKFYLGDSSDVTIYLGDTLLYPQSQPQPSVRYAVTEDISQYTATTYVDVYSMSDDLWYKKNNLNQFEEYGIFETGTSLSDFTYYPNKLVAVGETEYQYQSNGWVEVGEYIDVQTTYEVTDDSTALQGKELATTFKIPYADVEALEGWLNFRIRTSDGGNLQISTDYYNYMGSASYEGTVTNDGEYYYYSLPSEAPSSVIIQQTQYWDSTTIHLIFGQKEISVEYVDVPQPDFYNVYDTVADMEDETDLYYGKYGQVGNVVYKYATTDEWVATADKIMTGTTVSNIRSSTIEVTGGTNNIEKIYVNGTSVNGVHNWFFHNEESLSQISFDSYSYKSLEGLASFDWNTLDVSNMTTASTYLINGNFSHLREVDIPPYLTNINNTYISNDSSCPIRINVLGNGDIQLGTNGYFFSTPNTELYLPNGNSIIGVKSATCPRRNDDYLKVYVPSSAISKYRGNEMKYFIPFMELLDNGEADLSYSYYINSTSNTNPIINLTATALSSSWSSSTNSYADYVLIGENLRTVNANAFRGTATSYSSVKMRISRLKISNGVTSIGDHAFSKEEKNSYSQWNIEHSGTCLNTIVNVLEIPDSVETIGQSAFLKQRNGNYKIIIGSGCKDIGQLAFMNTKTTSPKGIVICKAVTPPTLHPTSNSYQSVFFKGVSTIDSIYVPDESVNTYKTATGWSEYASVIKSINDYVE